MLSAIPASEMQTEYMKKFVPMPNASITKPVVNAKDPKPIEPHMRSSPYLDVSGRILSAVVSNMGGIGALERAARRRTQNGAKTDASSISMAVGSTFDAATNRRGAKIPAMSPDAEVIYPWMLNMSAIHETMGGDIQAEIGTTDKSVPI